MIHRPFFFFNQPFTAPAVIPAMIYFCPKAYTTMIGTRIKTMMTQTRFQLLWNCPKKLYTIVVRGIFDELFIT